MSAVCPACGVAVVTGYVRCPKCHAALPLGARPRRSVADPGGTAVAPRPWPWGPVVGIGAVAAIALVFALRASRSAAPATAAEEAPVEEAPAGNAAAPIASARPAPVAPPPTSGATTAPTDPSEATRALDAALRRQRLWGRAAATADRVDVRSGSCGDPAMRALIDAQRSVLRAAGLTKLRCVEQSGAVVFERDLGP